MQLSQHTQYIVYLQVHSITLNHIIVREIIEIDMATTTFSSRGVQTMNTMFVK